MDKELRPEQVDILVGSPAVNDEFSKKVRELDRRLQANGMTYRDWETLNDRQHDIFSHDMFLDGECATSPEHYVKGAVSSCGCPDTEEELHHHSPVLMREIEKQQEMLPDMKVKIGEGLDNLNETIDLLLEGVIEEAATFAGELPDEDPSEFTGKRKSERQENSFIDLVNQTADRCESFTLVVGSMTLPGVIGASKKEGSNKYGKEPYTDVVLATNNGDVNISMKGGTAPSLVGGGVAGVNAMYPNLLNKLAPQIIQAYVEAGYTEGRAWASGMKAMKRLARKVLDRTTEVKKNGEPKFPQFFESQIILRTDSRTGGEVKEYPLYRDAPRGKGDDPLEWGPQGLPSQWGTSREFISSTKEGNVVFITAEVPKPDATAEEIKTDFGVKDLYLKIADTQCLYNLFVGNADLGGPINYLYKGATMDVDGRLEEDQSGGCTLIIKNDELIDAKTFVETYAKDKPAYFRIRKRGFDSQFTVAPVGKGGIGGFKIFTSGEYTGEGARIVVSDKPPKDAFFGPDITDCEG